jgi:hypothetical protein
MHQDSTTGFAINQRATSHFTPSQGMISDETGREEELSKLASILLTTFFLVASQL